MDFKFDGNTPIYLQIVDYIKTQIISKKYLPSQKIPSVRELSFMFSVNPNTIQKALDKLEDLGLIYTESTNGKFVTNNQEIIENIKQSTVDQMIDNFFVNIEKMGLSKNEVLDIINNKEKLWKY